MKEGRKEGGKRERCEGKGREREWRERREGDLHFLNLNVEWERWLGRQRKFGMKETSEERSHPRLDGCRHFDPNYERAFLIEGASRSIPSLSQHSRHGSFILVSGNSPVNTNRELTNS